MILDQKERIEKYEKLGVWGKGTILDRLEDAVKECPEREAFVDPPNRKDLTGHDPERITYRELKEKANSVALGLIEAGVKKDDIVVVQLPNTWELPMLYYAICKAGGIISPMPTQWRRKELEYVLQITGAKVYITIEEFNGFSHPKMAKEAKSKYPDLKMISLEEIRNMTTKQAKEEDFEGIEVVPADVWVLQWSSGTEAEPKACPRTHNNWYYCYAGDMLLQVEGMGCGRYLHPAQLVNNTGITYSLVFPLIGKGTSILHHPFDFELWLKQINEEKVDFAGLVPAMMNAILKHPKSGEIKLDTLKVAGTGAAPPSRWALNEFKSRYGVDMVNVWGQNEGPTIHSGPLTTPTEMRMQFPQFGKKGVDWGLKLNIPYVSAIETKIVDVSTGEEINKVGEVGELLWRGPEVMPCYFNNPEFTKKAFDEEGYIRTGDLFKVEENDFISFFDRKKDIIIRGGVNISAQEVENIVLKHPKVLDAAAVPMPDPVLGEKTCVYVVKKGEEDVTLDEIKSLFEKEEVAKYKWPERLELVAQIPRNPIGKIVKSNLKDDIKGKLDKE